MSKGGLTGAKVRIKALENENGALRQAVDHNNHETERMVQYFEQQINELVATGKAALSQAQTSISDLQSVNAELRDAAAEVQQQRDKAQKDAKTYRIAFWILFFLTGAAAAVDTVFYWSMFS